MIATESDQGIIVQRLNAMGIETRLMEGGRCALAQMRLQNPSFDTPSGSLRFDRVLFATVGHDRIKCLRPRALFQLPLLRTVNCRDAISIEARIRVAWQAHQRELVLARRWLESIGTHVSPDADHSILTFAIAGESPDTSGIAIDSSHVILPGRGPLSGITLQRAEDRRFTLDRSCSSSVDLDISISNRLEELKRLDARLTEQRRRDAMSETATVEVAPFVRDRKHRLLLVGSRLFHDRSCIESLRVRGYRVEAVQSESEALRIFDTHSPELVIADMNLGRSEGIELILALRGVPGLEEIPVVLVDDRQRPERRDAARQIGAAGYLTHPLQVGRIARRLSTLVNEPRRRRFTRYPQRLSVQIAHTETPSLAVTLGRGGMFLSTDHDLPTNSLHRCDISLPQLAHTLQVHTEVLYRSQQAATAHRGVGVRFHTFHDQHEPLLIAYLTHLDPGSQPYA
jgi:CheY-like chemotaxis protein